MATPTPVAPVRDDAREATIQAAYRTVFDPEARRSSHRSFWTTQPDTPTADEDLVGKVLRDDDADVVQVMNTPLQGDADSGTQHQNMTQVQVVRGRDGSYELYIDGIRRVEGEDGNAGTPVKIRHFRGPHRDEDSDKTLVGPLAISLMVESGQRAPDAAVLRVIQVTKVDGVPDAQAPRTVIHTLDLPSHSVDEYRAPSVTIPFPSWFTEPAHIDIDDVQSLRHYQARRKWRTFLPLILDFVIASLTLVYRTQQGAADPSTTEPLMNLLQTGNFAAFFREASRSQNLTQSLQVLAVIASTLLRWVGADSLAMLFRNVNSREARILADGIDTNTDPAGPREATPTVQREVYESVAQTALRILFRERQRPPFRKTRKYTLRGLTKAIRRLVEVDREAILRPGLDFNSIIRRNYKDESVLADWLMESADADDEYIPGMDDDDRSWMETFGDWARNARRLFRVKKLEDYINNTLGPWGFSPQEQQPGKPAQGLLSAKVGKANLSGLDYVDLRKNYVRTQVEIAVYDSNSAATSESEWKIVLEAEEECGFRAGWYACGAHNDVIDLMHAIDDFKTAFCAEPRYSELLTWQRLNAGARIEMPVSTALLCYHGYGKLTSAMFIGDQSEDGQERQRSLIALEHRYTIPVRKITAPQEVYFRKIGVRFILHSNSSYSLQKAEASGVFAVNDGNETSAFVHPIDRAVSEARRHLLRYVTSNQTLVSMWECYTETRLIWYQCFERDAKNDIINTDSAISLIGGDRLSFTNDGITMPLEVRDRLSRIVSSSTVDDTFPISLISKPITKYDDTPQKQKPRTHHEVVARHAYADMLIGRLIMRGMQSPGLSATMGADADVKQAINPMTEMFKSCKQEHSKGYQGIMSRNDVYFQCYPFGSDLSKVLHACGTWSRSKTVAIDSGAVEIDNTYHQRIEKQNMWPSEAETHAQNVISSLRRIHALPQDILPVYALQNTLSLADSVNTKDVAISDTTSNMIFMAMHAYRRTMALCDTTACTQIQKDSVIRDQMLRWPTLFSLVTALNYKGLIGKLNGALDAPTGETVSSKEVTPSTFVPPLDALGTDDGYGLTMLEDRAQRMRKDLWQEGLEYPLTSAPDDSAWSYHVPFSQGDEPFNYTRSFAYPGVEGIESMPIWVQHIGKVATRLGSIDVADQTQHRIECTDKQTSPLEIRIAIHSRNKASAHCMLASVLPLGGNESIPAQSSGTLGSLLSSLIMTETGSSHEQHFRKANIVSVVMWNTERIVQTILLMIGRRLDITDNSVIQIIPPDGPRNGMPQDIRLPKRNVQKKKLELRRAVTTHFMFVQGLIEKWATKYTAILTEFQKKIYVSRAQRRWKLLSGVGILLLAVAAAFQSTLDPLDPSTSGASLNDGMNFVIEQEDEDNPVGADEMIRLLNDRLYANVYGWIVDPAKFDDNAVYRYGTEILRQRPNGEDWIDDHWNLVSRRVYRLVNTLNREYNRGVRMFNEAEGNRKQELGAMLDTLRSARSAITPAIRIRDEVWDEVFGTDEKQMLNGTIKTAVDRAMYEYKTAKNHDIEMRKKLNRQNREVDEQVQRAQRTSDAGVAVSAILAGAMLTNTIGWAPEMRIVRDPTSASNTPRSTASKSGVDALKTIGVAMESDRSNVVALVEACTVFREHIAQT